MKIVSTKEEVSAYLGQDIGNVLFSLHEGFVRIVDPNQKSVELIMKSMEENLKSCFSIWARDSACKNCISLSAIATNQPISKLETDGKEIFLVHSLPITLSSGKKVALEVIRNLSNVQFRTKSLELGLNLDPVVNFIR